MEKNSKETQNNQNGTIVVVNQTEKETNGIGITGFVLALCALLFSWTPILNWILWTLGLIFSLIGIFRKPRGLAIAGLVLSCLDIILVLALTGVIVTVIGALI